MTDIIEDIEQSVEEATDRKSFNIVDVVRNRAYPKTTVKVYLNEEAAYTASELQEQLEDSYIIDGDSGDSELTKRLKELFDEAIDILKSSEYVFTIRGISEGTRTEIMEKALEQCPMEYEEVKNNLTGIVSKIEIENKDRDKIFTNLLWSEQIETITDPYGNIQNGLTVDNVAELRNSLPMAAIAAINEAIEKVRVSTAIFMSKVNEDFLAKR